MPIQSEDHDAPELAAGVLPAKKALVHVAAQRAVLALAEDLLVPGVQRATNWHLIRVIAAIQGDFDAYTPAHLVELARQYNVNGETDDEVHGLVLAFCAARSRFEAER